MTWRHFQIRKEISLQNPSCASSCSHEICIRRFWRSEVVGSSVHMSKTTKLAPFERFWDFTFVYQQTVDLLVHPSDVWLVIVETVLYCKVVVCLLHNEQICHKIRRFCFTCFSVLCGTYPVLNMWNRTSSILISGLYFHGIL